MNRSELAGHIETIEKSYEFFLAYAAQGAAGDAESRVGGQLRDYLKATDEALRALHDGIGTLAAEEGLEGHGAYADIAEVVAEDAARAGAAVRVVLAQPSIGAQMIDNLNASTHLRAVLTDLFLLDDVV